MEILTKASLTGLKTLNKLLLIQLPTLPINVTNHKVKLLKQYQLKSDFDKNIVLKKLENVTETWHKEDTETQLFEGKVNGDIFKLYPTYDLAPRDQFRPEVEVTLKQKEGFTQINLSFRLPNHMKRFFPSAFIIYSIAQLILLYFYFLTDFKIPVFFMFVPLIFSLLVYYQTKHLFNSRSKKALGHLTKILDLKY